MRGSRNTPAATHHSRSLLRIISAHLLLRCRGRRMWWAFANSILTSGGLQRSRQVDGRFRGQGGQLPPEEQPLAAAAGPCKKLSSCIPKSTGSRFHTRAYLGPIISISSSGCAALLFLAHPADAQSGPHAGRLSQNAAHDLRLLPEKGRVLDWLSQGSDVFEVA